jgi:fatty-acyl-CoA synthase
VEGERSVTYAGLREASERFAAALVRAGVEPGDRVAHWMGNRIEWAVVKFGTELAGALHVPLNTRYRTEDAGYVLRQSRANALVFGARLLEIDFVEVVGRLLPELSSSEPGRLRAEAYPDLRTVVCLDEAMPGTFEFASFLDGGSDPASLRALPARRRELSTGDVVNVLYTSGTTGSPKGALITHGNVLANVEAGPPHINRTAADRWLLALPLFHTFGCMMGLVYPMSVGGSTVLLDRFEAGQTMIAIERHGCTVLEGVPTMFSDILEHPDRQARDLSTWRKLYVGGAHSSEAFLTRLRDELGLAELLTGFGMTEHTGLSCATRPGDAFDLISRTIGTPLGAFEFSIRDPVGGAELPRGQQGEICARGAGVTSGYFDKPEETRAAFHAGGWMRSGDLGLVDPASGYLRITGRLKDLYITGGENVAPAEVEKVIGSHPAVAEVCVCGVPDRRLGEVGAAFVRTRQSAALGEEELLAFCKERMANFKAPRYVVFVETFPQTASGKIQRFKLRESAVADLGLGEESP